MLGRRPKGRFPLEVLVKARALEKPADRYDLGFCRWDYEDCPHYGCVHNILIDMAAGVWPEQEK